MKKITMFYLQSCPHCVNAQKMMDELMSKNPKYKSIKVEKIEESKNAKIASTYDYYYVPTYYVDGQKVHEGIPTLEKVENVFKKATE
jgi:glutaredoxin